MGMFSQRTDAPGDTPVAAPMPPAARVDLNELYEWFCELVRPPKALIGRFHRNRIAPLARAEAAVSAELERRGEALRVRAALLNPIPEKSSFHSGMRDALESAQRRRFGLNAGDFS